MSTLETPAPLPYHRAVRDHFKERVPELWRFFAGRETPEALRENVRLQLLKSAFRLERTDREELYRAADEVAARLGLSEGQAPITLYQAQSGEGMNAGLYFAPGEIHVVLQGPVLEKLSDEEMRALLGHEFTHYAFLVAHDDEYQTTLSILDALTQGSDTEFAHLATARNFDLYTEILCDRGALAACGEPLPAIATLCKVSTGLSEVNPESYVRQAEEIFASGKIEAEGGSHPEAFIRTRALTLFAEQGAAAEAEIAAMIEGETELDRLDLLGQSRVAAATRHLIQSLMAHDDLRGESHLAQAHLYFEDFSLQTAPPLGEALACSDPGLRDYYCYVVLDFVAVDRDVLDTALAHGLTLFTPLSFDDRLAELASQELGLRKREMEKIRKLVEKSLEAQA